MLSLARRMARLEKLVEEGIPGGVYADRMFNLETLFNIHALFGERGVKAWWQASGFRDFLRKVDPNWESIEGADRRGDRLESVSEEGSDHTLGNEPSL